MRDPKDKKYCEASKRIERIKRRVIPLFDEETPEAERDEIRRYLAEEDNKSEKTKALAEIISEASKGGIYRRKKRVITLRRRKPRSRSGSPGCCPARGCRRTCRTIYAPIWPAAAMRN
jgi:hypothetical protein